MQNIQLANFYERNLRRIIKEINLISIEEVLWKTMGPAKISCGELVLLIIEGTNHFVRTASSQCEYNCYRDEAIIRKNVERKVLVEQLEKVIRLMNDTINALTPDQMDADYPLTFDNSKRSTSDVLIQFLFQLNYHLGQINYLRRHLNNTYTTSVLKGSMIIGKLYQN